MVVIDGEKWRTVRTTTGRARVSVTKRLLQGRHTVRVRFRPADRTAFRPATQPGAADRRHRPVTAPRAGETTSVTGCARHPTFASVGAWLDAYP